MHGSQELVCIRPCCYRIELAARTDANGVQRTRLGSAHARRADARLRHDDLRRDVGARGRHGEREPGAGLPRHGRSAGDPRSRCAAIRSGHNQYPPGPGIPELRHAISAHQLRRYGLEYDPDAEVLVTAGATEAIAAALLALSSPATRSSLFEPYYDSYAACIALAGRPPTHRDDRRNDDDWAFDPAALDEAVRSRTKAILLNTPHNPTGKVFGPAELAAIADVAIDAT